MKAFLIVLFCVSAVGALNPMGCVSLAKKTGVLTIKCPEGYAAINNERCVQRGNS